MAAAPFPANESERLDALLRYRILDTLPEQDFDDFTSLAAYICKTPIALITLVDEYRQWFKSRLGLEMAETPREQSFCAHAIVTPADVMVVEDAHADARFADNVQVTGDPHIRFYAGAPLVTPDGLALGTLCVIDREPRQLEPNQIQALSTLARLVVNQLELRRMSRQQEQERQRYLHKIAAQAPGALYEFQMTLDGVMSFPFISQGITKLHPRLTPEALKADGNLGLLHIHSDDAEAVRASIEESFRALTQWDVEFRVTAPDGSIRWHHGSANPERQADGTVSWYGLLQDITERKQVIERIRRDAARWAALARMTSRVNAQLDLPFVLAAVCEETAQVLNVPAVGLFLVDETDSHLNLAANIGLPDADRLRQGALTLEKFEELVRQYPADVNVIEDVANLPDLPDAGFLSDWNFRTVVAVNLRQGGRLFGSLVAFSPMRRYGDEDRALLKSLADLAVNAVVNARLYADSRRRLARLQTIQKIDEAIANVLDLNVVARIFAHEAAAELGADAVNILMLEPQTNSLRFLGGRGFGPSAAKLAKVRLRLGEGFSGRVALERQMLHVANLPEVLPQFVRAASLAEENFASYIGMPLIAKGQVKGVLEIFHRSRLDPEPEWFEFLHGLARQAAIAIDNAQLFEGLLRSNTDLSLAYDATIEGWSRAMDLRDKETEGHTQRVTEMTVRLAREAGMTELEIVQVRRGALLHDMGKLGVPDNVLLKPGKLTDEEWAIMRQHPRFAYDMLSPVAYLRPALDIPYYHHEKWDGTGYPRGLKDEQIPLAARLFAVVDVWDALRSDRPYRSGWPEEKVLEHIRSQSGAHFDPKAVDLFMSAIEKMMNE